jgi:hypothetical protein
MPGYAKRQNRNKSGKSRPTVVPANREYYSGANQTRNSIANNPGAWSSPKQPEFGLKTFGRTTFMPSEDVLDAAAEKQISQGYTRRKNPICPSCFVQMPTTKVCGTC